MNGARVLPLLVVALAAGCGSPSHAPAAPAVVPAAPPSTTVAPQPAPPPAATPVTARALFCAYGGVGIVPNPLPPGFESEFVAVAFELDNPGPPVPGVTVRAVSLIDAAGASVASMHRLVHFVDLTSVPPPPPDWGSFAVYLNPDGTPFSGTLPTGRTRLRVRASLDHATGGPPDRCRVELGGLGASPPVVEGRVDGAWPTS